MGGLRDFEQRLENLVSGAFARAFRSAVQPVEIAAALQRECDNNTQILSRGRRIVPNSFTVELSPADYERLADYSETVASDLASQVEDHAEHQGYVFPGPVRVTLEQADDLTTGRFRARGRAEASVQGHTRPHTDRYDDRHDLDRAYDQSDQGWGNYPGSTAGAASHHPSNPPIHTRRARAWLAIHGEDHALTPPSVVVGRGSQADIQINDPGISRRHAEFHLTRGRLDDDDLDIVAVDLGSTNGIVFQGQRADRVQLSDGDTVRLGNTDITVRIETP